MAGRESPAYRRCWRPRIAAAELVWRMEPGFNCDARSLSRLAVPLLPGPLVVAWHVCSLVGCAQSQFIFFLVDG